MKHCWQQLRRWASCNSADVCDVSVEVKVDEACCWTFCGAVLVLQHVTVQFKELLSAAAKVSVFSVLRCCSSSAAATTSKLLVTVSMDRPWRCNTALEHDAALHGLCSSCAFSSPREQTAQKLQGPCKELQGPCKTSIVLCALPRCWAAMWCNSAQVREFSVEIRMG
jgi:hypothetical protein